MQFWYFSFETRYIIIFHNDEKWISSLTEKICEITFRSYITTLRSENDDGNVESVRENLCITHAQN